MKNFFLMVIVLTGGLATGRWLIPERTPSDAFDRPDQDQRLPAIHAFIATHEAILQGDPSCAGVSMTAEPSRGGGRLVVSGSITSAEDFPLLVAIVTSMADIAFAVPIRTRWEVVDRRGTVLTVPSLVTAHDELRAADTALRRSVPDQRDR